MGTHYNSKIPGDPKFYFDISNPKCISDPGNTTVDSNTRLTDLISGTVQLQANDTSGNQTFVLYKWWRSMLVYISFRLYKIK